MEDSAINLALSIEEIDAEADRLDELTTYLMDDLKELGVESVERPGGEDLPEGAKGDPVTWGVLALAVMPTLLPQMVEYLQSWTLRGENRIVKIKMPDGLEVEFTPEKKMNPAEVASLVRKFSKATSEAPKKQETEHSDSIN